MQNWSDYSKELNNRRIPFFKEKEVWWTAIGINIGHEENGKGEQYVRPVLVLKKFGRATFLGVPFSTSLNTHKLDIEFQLNGRLNKALISQQRTYDARRLLTKIGKLDQELFDRIRKTAKDIL